MVAPPGEGSATTYHLRPPGGGAPWSAPADGRALGPVPVKATHATLLAGRDAIYDRRARQGSVPIEFRFDDGSTLDGALILTSVELERLHVQTQPPHRRARSCPRRHPMTGARRRHARKAPPLSLRPEGGGIALAVLAVAGLVGPAWALREQAAPLLNGPSHPPSAVAPDASLSSDH
ncbi:hypothetical protein SCWH03_26140 [Streptomyces pacificus]|uniref:Uncharacterized protein n=1 Tax=Streptomyces pacificus TaxID=2705029 RepID=A0A6A0AU46_9ACTN|nr:hypothetical protein SCWH03_26140 [Streptomyces pacificus]